MRASEALELHREEIRRIVHAHKAENPRVFGSVATGTDDDESDLDLLIDPLDGMSLFDLGGIYNDLELLLPVKVDVCIARSLRPRYKDRILSEAKPL
jgi:predicted nucleotidyltransferase